MDERRPKFVGVLPQKCNVLCTQHDNNNNNAFENISAAVARVYKEGSTPVHTFDVT